MYCDRRSWWVTLLLLMVFLAGGGRAVAQATFRVSSSAPTVIRTGHTEPAGSLTLTVSSGITAPGDIEISLQPATLTNADSGITLSRSGSNAARMVTHSLSPEAGLVRLTVPAGMGAGDSVTITGIRVSVPNSGIETLYARISTTGNRLAAGQKYRSGHCQSGRCHHRRSFQRYDLYIQREPGPGEFTGQLDV